MVVFVVVGGVAVLDGGAYVAGAGGGSVVASSS